MAFKLKSKLTSGGLMGHSANKPKLNNSSKTPFFQLPENFVATKTATKLDGTVVPIEGTSTETKVYENARPYEEVYNDFEVDPATGEAINSITGTRYSNIQEFKDDAKEDSETTTLYKGEYDVTDGTPDKEINYLDVFKKYGREFLRENRSIQSKREDFRAPLMDAFREKNPSIDFDDPNFTKEMKIYYAELSKMQAARKLKEDRIAYRKSPAGKQEERKKRSYCSEMVNQNKPECKNRDSNGDKIIKPKTRVLKGKPRSETYVAPTKVN
tara:strand:- start:61 stop:870 length:810 start_codon:yes stop_codon:yes gene_type:complete